MLSSIRLKESPLKKGTKQLEKSECIFPAGTWGGLVGVLGYPKFIDGGVVTAPNLAFFDEKGFGIENVGTTPDVEVEQWPAEVINGHDPQLVKAIQLVLEELKNNRAKKAPSPQAPIKARL